MSAGFRIFLLILAAFGAIYAYRFRYPELANWLQAQSAPLDPGSGDGLVSPVEHILERDVSLARLELQSPPRRRPERVATRRVENAEALQAEAALPEGADREAADLVTVTESEEGVDAPAEGGVVEADPLAEAPQDATRTPAELPGLAPHYEEVEYRVETGDSLWRIAARKLGSGSRFEEIRDANPEVFRGQGTDVVQPGTVLKLRVPIREELFKNPSRDADSTVEGNSAQVSPEPRRKSLRQSVQHAGKSRWVAQE